MGYLLVAINIVFLLFVAAKTNMIVIRRYALTGGLLTLGWMVLTLFRFYQADQNRARFIPGYLFPAFIWMLLGWPLFSVVLLLLATLDFIVRRTLSIHFWDDHIVYPSLPKKIIPWSAIAHVILKDGLLTLDYKDNTIQQVMIEEEAEEADFNRYVQERLQSAQEA
jgi:hypothetical protein